MKGVVVLIIVVFAAVPVLAESSLVAVVLPGWGIWSHATKERQDGSVLAIAADKQDLNTVRGRVRLYLKPDVSIEDIRKVRCEIIIDGYHVSDISKHLIEGYYGPELWFEHIPRGTLAELALYGEKFPPEIFAVTFEVTSDEGNRDVTWLAKAQEEATPFYAFHEVTLNEMCEEFGSENASS